MNFKKDIKYRDGYNSLCNACMKEKLRLNKVNKVVVEPKQKVSTGKCNKCLFLVIPLFKFPDNTRTIYCEKFNRHMGFTKDDKVVIKRPTWCDGGKYEQSRMD